MNNQLSEKDFIHESTPSGGWRVWLGLGSVALVFILMVFLTQTVHTMRNRQIERSPFFRVTNRDFSLFLWDNPEYMRSNRKKKAGYLSGYHSYPKSTPIPEQADEWVSAPADILFLYHAWERLLGNETFSRAVTVSEFREFLDDDKEWQPKYWESAPQDYRELVVRLPEMDIEDLRERLPPKVLQAFIGWKNFYKEGERINAAVYTEEEVAAFIDHHPHYAANYWRHLYPAYLRSLDSGSEAEVPSGEIPSFLKVALFNNAESH